MSKITYSDKNINSQLTHSDVNEIKNSVNVLYDTSGSTINNFYTSYLIRTGQTFNNTTGILLDYNETHYFQYTASTSITVVLASGSTVGSSAEIEVIGNGINSWTFTNFIQYPGSDIFSNILGKRNQIYFNKIQSGIYYFIKLMN